MHIKSYNEPLAVHCLIIETRNILDTLKSLLIMWFEKKHPSEDKSWGEGNKTPFNLSCI